MTPPDGGGGGGVRVGAPRVGVRGTNVTRNTPRFDAITKWLNEVSGVHQFDLGGISEQAQEKILYGLEKHGRPVTRVTPYMTSRTVEAGQRYLARTNKPTKNEFWAEVEKSALGVMIERIANAGGDLRSTWAAHPLTAAYREQKAKKYPGKPMGQASGKLLSEMRSTRAFAVKSR